MWDRHRCPSENIRESFHFHEFPESCDNFTNSVRSDYEENLMNNVMMKKPRISGKEFSNVPKTGILRNSSENSQEISASHSAVHTSIPPEDAN
ncbi:hypothetical protein B9Z55_007836 [Caenorhabditis nigoni]|uniref:Uncharacterized protein n=1 Tax=Caenorhabditis nigoni TaxID=1611254 RepID=A0A2G5VBF8_9PELO|nr:hypothetical protein B9Z55_007836 [Caenorhabditis nigoni]